MRCLVTLCALLLLGSAPKTIPAPLEPLAQRFDAICARQATVHADGQARGAAPVRRTAHGTYYLAPWVDNDVPITLVAGAQVSPAEHVGYPQGYSLLRVRNGVEPLSYVSRTDVPRINGETEFQILLLRQRLAPTQEERDEVSRRLYYQGSSFFLCPTVDEAPRWTLARPFYNAMADGGLFYVARLLPLEDPLPWTQRLDLAKGTPAYDLSTDPPALVGIVREAQQHEQEVLYRIDAPVGLDAAIDEAIRRSE